MGPLTHTTLKHLVIVVEKTHTILFIEIEEIYNMGVLMVDVAQVKMTIDVFFAINVSNGS
jgi:hypothetical protein